MSDREQELTEALNQSRAKVSELAVKLGEAQAEIARLRHRVGDGDGPMWNCGHRHLFRKDAIDCLAAQRPSRVRESEAPPNAEAGSFG